MKIEVYLERSQAALETLVWIVGTDKNGKRVYCKPMDMIFEEMPEYGARQPSLVFSDLDPQRGLLQALSEGLARAGYRQENNDAQELKAVKFHLEDMRKLVFKAPQEPRS